MTAIVLAACGAASPSPSPSPSLSPSPSPSKARASRRGDARAGSSIALVDVDASPHAIVADVDGNALHVVELGDARASESTLPLDGRPSQIVVARGGRVFCALRDAATVVVLAFDDAHRLRETARWPTAADPIALALSPDEATLAVASGAGRALELFATDDGARKRVTSLSRSARAVTFASRGDRIAVAHAVGSLVTLVDAAGNNQLQSLHSKRVDVPKMDALPLLHANVVATGDDFVIPGVAVATGDTSVRTKDGYGHLTVEHIPAERFQIVRTLAPPNVAAIDASALARAGMMAESCVLPRAAAIDTDALYVACTGPGRLFKIDLGTRSARSWSAPYAIPDGVTGIAIDAARRVIVAWSPAEGELANVPLDATPSIDDARVLPGGPAVPIDRRAVVVLRARSLLPEQVARGRAIFHATNLPTISSDGRACASCHIDGADDGLTWPTPEGPRQTPMLAGRVAATAPYGWTGKRKLLEDHLAETIKRLGGRGLREADRTDLVAFLHAMPTPPRAKVDAALAARGRAVFAAMGTACATCHAGSLFIDAKTHDVKSRGKGDAADFFDTPSLAFVAQTAPYFHDGRYATLGDLLEHADGAMGKTKHLSPDDRTALELYLQSM